MNLIVSVLRMVTVLTLSSVGSAGAASFESAMKAPAPPVTYLPGKQVSQAFVKGMPLVRGVNYKVDTSHRDEPGVVEVHTRDTDIVQRRREPPDYQG
jgi:hypothetical protein